MSDSSAKEKLSDLLNQLAEPSVTEPIGAVWDEVADDLGALPASLADAQVSAAKDLLRPAESLGSPTQWTGRDWAKAAVALAAAGRSNKLADLGRAWLSKAGGPATEAGAAVGKELVRTLYVKLLDPLKPGAAEDRLSARQRAILAAFLTKAAREIGTDPSEKLSKKALHETPEAFVSEVIRRGLLEKGVAGGPASVVTNWPAVLDDPVRFRDQFWQEVRDLIEPAGSFALPLASGALLVAALVIGLLVTWVQSRNRAHELATLHGGLKAELGTLIPDPATGDAYVKAVEAYKNAKEKSLADSKAETRAREADIAGLKGDLAKARTAIADLETNKKALIESRDTTRNQLDTTTKERDGLAKDKTDLTAALTDLRKQFADRGTELEKTKTSLADTTKKLTDTSAKLATTEGTLAKTKDDLTSTAAKLAAAEKSLADTSKNLTATAAKLTTTETALTETKGKLTTAEAKIVALGKELDTAKTDATTKGTALAKAQADLTAAAQRETTLKADLATAKTAVTTTEGKLATSEAAAKKLDADLKAANAALTTAKADLATAKTALTTAEGKATTAEAAAKKARDDLGAAQTSLADTKIALTKAEADAKTAKAEVTTLTKQVADLKKEIEELKKKAAEPKAGEKNGGAAKVAPKTVPAVAAGDRGKDAPKAELLGAVVRNLVTADRPALNLAADAKGIVVAAVKDGTPAAKAGLKADEVIVEVRADFAVGTQTVSQSAEIGDVASLSSFTERVATLKRDNKFKGWQFKTLTRTLAVAEE